MAKRSPTSRSRSADRSKTGQVSDRSQNVTVPTDPEPVQPTEASPANTRASSPSAEPSDEAIRRRAYQRYLARGGQDGTDFEDWLEAERELKRGDKG